MRTDAKLTEEMIMFAQEACEEFLSSHPEYAPIFTETRQIRKSLKIGASERLFLVHDEGNGTGFAITDKGLYCMGVLFQPDMLTWDEFINDHSEPEPEFANLGTQMADAHKRMNVGTRFEHEFDGMDFEDEDTQIVEVGTGFPVSLCTEDMDRYPGHRAAILHLYERLAQFAVSLKGDSSAADAETPSATSSGRLQDSRDITPGLSGDAEDGESTETEADLDEEIPELSSFFGRRFTLAFGGLAIVSFAFMLLAILTDLPGDTLSLVLELLIALCCCGAGAPATVATAWEALRGRGKARIVALAAMLVGIGLAIYFPYADYATAAENGVARNAFTYIGDAIVGLFLGAGFGGAVLRELVDRLEHR